MILADANVLIYAVDRDSAHHAAARKWLESAVSGGELALTWQVVLAFLRIVTRAGILRRPLDVGEALDLVDRWLGEGRVRIAEAGPEHWPILRGLLAETGAAGNLTSDAHLAAHALEHGAAVATFDHDLRRFPGLRVVVPGRGKL